MSNLALIKETIPTEIMQEKIRLLEIEAKKLPQFQPETNHTFHGGIYCRDGKLNANQVAVGLVHKTEHIFFVVSGTVRITTPDGIETITGPALFKSKPGTKRACYTITDVHFMNIHRTDCTNIEDVEKELVEYDPTSMFGVGNILKSNLIGGI